MKNFRITVNGNSYDVAVEELGAGAAPTAVPMPVSAPAPSPAPAAKPVANVSGTKVTAPMPGKIVDVKVSVGQDVKKGTVLLTLEAMKMENEILSPCDGKVGTISTQKGANVDSGDLLVAIN